MKKWMIIFAVAITQHCYGQLKLNGSFEYIDPLTKKPLGWMLSLNKAQEDAYSVKIDSTVKLRGKYSISIQKINNLSDYRMLDYIVLKKFEGQTIELYGDIKTKDVDKGFAGLWIRLDGNSKMIALENMQEQNVRGTRNWKRYKIQLPYQSDVKVIHYGAILAGNGKAWFDNLELKIDGKRVERAALKVLKKAITDTSFSQSSKIKNIVLSPQQITNISIVGQYWGFLKYHHPQITGGNLNWDAELFRLLPEALKAKTNKELSNSLEKNLDKLSLPRGYKTDSKDNRYQEIRPDYGDLLKPEILTETLVAKLTHIRNNRNVGENYWLSKSKEGTAIFKNEKSYQEMIYPDQGYRLLCLFRYWAMVNYFYPNKNLIKGDWKDVLEEFIPSFVTAPNEIAYTLAVLKIISRLNDSHANIWGWNQTLNNLKGNYSAPFRAKFIENKLVVTDLYIDTSIKSINLKIGDVINSIGGQKVTDLIKAYQPIVPASNHDTQLRDMPNNLLRSNTRELKIEVLRGSDTLSYNLPTVKLELTYRNKDFDKSKGYFFVNKEIGYINAGMYKNSELPSIIKKINNSKGLIIDLRAYPSDIMAFTLGNYIKSRKTPFVKFMEFNLSLPGSFEFSRPLKNGGRWFSRQKYRGKVVVIVNSETQSRGEFTTMAFQSASNVVVLGSQTAGSDGDVSSIVLPGGIETMISGIGVYYPDNKPTQGLGVKIDILVKPTILGILEGKDELLYKAIDFLKHRPEN